MDKVAHFEIPFENKEKCMEFYGDAFGWQFQDMPEMNYTIARTGEVDEDFMMKEKGVINGGMMKKPDFLSGPTITIEVQDIDSSISKIKEAGGEIVKDKMKVGEMGYVAYFKDTEGNVLGLWQNIKK